MKTDEVLDALITAGLGNGIRDRERISDLLSAVTETEWEEVWRRSEMHQIWGTVHAGISAFPDAAIPENIVSRFADAREKVSYQYFYMLSFTTFVLDLLSGKGIRCYVLKGITLNALYPEEEARKLADVDIYVPDPDDFARADTVLREQGFQPQEDYTDIHNGYMKNVMGKNCVLELHRKPSEGLADAAAEREADRIWKNLPYKPDWYTISGIKVPALPPTEYAFQLLLHMFAHFVHAGFGLRMLCDWCVFWKGKGSETDAFRFLGYLERTSLTGFAWAVTQGCIRHMGMNPDHVLWMDKVDGALYKDSAEMFWMDVMQGGEFGKGDKSRLVIFQNRTFLGACAYEIHRMMCIRFPRFRKCAAAWPFLWAATILIFLRNNRKLDRGGTGKIIESAGNRKSLLKKMKVFKLD